MCFPKGAVIGPLVVAGVTIDKEHESKLKKLGVKDSKMLSPKKREELAGKIEGIASNIIVLRVQPCMIDDMRDAGTNLDRIEAMKMAEIIDLSSGSTVYVDALTSNPKKFEGVIRGYTKSKEYDVVVKNYLDESVIAVSAASIIAKVERDKAIQEIKDRVNFDFGVGYPHDQRTIDFVKSLISQKRDLPTFVRKSWITTQLLIEESWQKKVKDFFIRKEDCKEGAR